MTCENGQFPNSIFSIDRTYTTHLVKAIEAAQAKADELGLVLSKCSTTIERSNLQNSLIPASSRFGSIRRM
ncbi:hypothetical protein [Paenibacillus alvei]|uniref:hypothetical protein n=1 Tax=Paenibacillus alvei TaxID=44250 RepID=UPI0018CE5A78|nr:hypothetical protein [Paenibacillus alvei]MBG9733326.1 hypothetical protein [Paenibacillus alvei]MBG9745115.1 hypothetical protein [Paenibacillus alvei]MCY9580763.1 hypothetical protein [Paenibacillus alvei]MCY9585246.1 hypothetical protein [Paenibacillus alvei]